jgi:hypothetical protein
LLAFGSLVSSEDVYRRYARPGIERAAEPDSRIVERRGGDIFSAYNAVLDEVRDADDLEAVVLLHEDTEIQDPAFAAKLRARLRDPSVAVVGAIGTRGVRSIAWWEGPKAFGWLLAPNLEPGGVIMDHGGGAHEVDAVDGLILVLSPWAARNLRFDERTAPGFHGYDVDICLQARIRGRKVFVEELRVAHQTRGGLGDREAWMRAHAAFRRKWDRAVLGPHFSGVSPFARFGPPGGGARASLPPAGVG